VEQVFARQIRHIGGHVRDQKVGTKVAHNPQHLVQFVHNARVVAGGLQRVMAVMANAVEHRVTARTTANPSVHGAHAHIVQAIILGQVLFIDR